MEKAAQMKLAEARTLIEKGATKLDAAVLADSSARHDAAKALFDEGAGALQNGEFIVAFQKLKESLFAAEKLVVLLKTYRRLKSDVRSRSVEIRLEREDRRGEGASTSQSEENDGEVSKEDISKPLREVREGAGELDFSGESVGH